MCVLPSRHNVLNSPVLNTQSFSAVLDRSWGVWFAPGSQVRTISGVVDVRLWDCVNRMFDEMQALSLEFRKHHLVRRQVPRV